MNGNAYGQIYRLERIAQKHRNSQLWAIACVRALNLIHYCVELMFLERDLRDWMISSGNCPSMNANLFDSFVVSEGIYESPQPQTFLVPVPTIGSWPFLTLNIHSLLSFTSFFFLR
jgi:hypothetical protein